MELPDVQTSPNSSPQKGVFIAIEGSDGSGKQTQTDLLVAKLREEGHEVETFDFPQYGQPSAFFIEQYLSGELGDKYELGPYTPSYFFALDRYEASKRIKQALDDGKIVIANRFSGSNMAHQGAKFDRREERLGFFTWVDHLEHETLGTPRPDLNILLAVPAEVSQKLIEARSKEKGSKKDFHEEDHDFLKRSVAAYEDLAMLFSKSFTTIDCSRDGELLDKDTIHKLVWERSMAMLPKRKPKKADPSANQPAKVGNDGAKTTSKPVKKQSPYVRKNPNGSSSITEKGHDYLKDVVTNSDKDVYVFTDKMSPVTVAAGMARLSRRADDMRITILDEFADKLGKDEKLLNRVITAYGDDSVQQLAGTHVVVENASNWLTKKLEWGRLAAYLEQSTRYIYFDQRDESGNYRYFTPKNLDAKMAKTYEEKMDQIFDLYSEMVHKVTTHVRDNSSEPEESRDVAWKGATRAQACDVIRPVLPVSTKATVGIFASGQALESLIMHLLSDPMQEARDVGQQILDEARKTIPVFLERADKPDRGGATIAYRANTFNKVRELANEHLSGKLSDDQETKLVDVWPRNELDLVPHILYEHSNLSVEELKEEVAEWTYDQKSEVFNAYIGERLNRRHKPGRAFEQAHYSWDIICDYGIFRDLQRHRMVDDMQWQELTPRYGYEVPDLVEEAGVTDLYEKCFDISYQLYSEMQAAGFELEAQYATLLGHRMRWKMMYNARQAFHFHELRTAPQGHPGYRKLVKEMHDTIAEVHPKIAEAMTFVNQDEDPELTRLAAERYTQYKLDKLDKTD